MSTRTALVTGASAGIGTAIARELARRGVDLVITARRVDRLEALAQELRGLGRRVEVIAADLADPAAPERLVSEIAARGLAIDVLVNNAGYGLPGQFLSCEWPQHADFLEVLLRAPVRLCHLLLPGMRQRRYGRILNIASLAGLVPSSAGHTLYGATKSFLIKFSQSLGQEFKAEGIHVCALCPGFTYSEFHDVNGMRAKVSTMPAFMWMDATTVARQGLDAVEAGELIHVNGVWNRFVAVLAKLLPGALALALVSRQAHRFRDQST